MGKVITESEYATLLSVRDRVLVLAGECPAFREQLAGSVTNYSRYVNERESAVSESFKRKRERAKEVLANGRICEEGATFSESTYFAKGWLYPPEVRQIEREYENALRDSSASVAKLESKLARCLLASFQKQDGEPFDPAAPQLIPDNREAGVLLRDYTPTIVLLDRAVNRPPVRVGSFSEREGMKALALLQRDAPEHYRVIAFASLRGLADCLTTSPIIPRPHELDCDATEEERMQNLVHYFVWRKTFPLDHDASANPESAIPDERVLPVHIARNFLQVAEEMVSECGSRNAKDAIQADSPKGKSSLPKTKRGLARFFQNETKDSQVIALLQDNLSYREIERRTGVSKATVGRIAKANGLTGDRPETTNDADGLTVKRGRSTH
jgi:hypothetical protein